MSCQCCGAKTDNHGLCLKGCDSLASDYIAQLEADVERLRSALRPFGDAYRFLQTVPSSMVRQYESSMSVTRKFTTDDLRRAAELTDPA